MLFVVKERCEGLKYNIDFRERGWGYTGGGDTMSSMQKGAVYRSFSTLLSLIVDNLVDCKTVRIIAYSSKREQSNERSGTRLKTESETGERR